MADKNVIGYRDQYENIVQNRFIIQQAKESAASQDVIIIDPEIDNEEVLDGTWQKYMEMTKPFRRKADWITIEFLGLNNQTIYEIKKSDFLKIRKHDIFEVDGNIGTSDDPLIYEAYSGDVQNYTSAPDIVDAEGVLANIDFDIANKFATQFMKDTGFIIINPVIVNGSINRLEKAWEAFNMMTHKHRRVSDWKCLELYGLTNMQFYIYLKDKLNSMNFPTIKDPELYDQFDMIRSYFNRIVQDESTTGKDIAEGLTNLLSFRDSYDEVITANIISDVIDNYEGLTQNIPTMDINVSDLPMYTPDEMIDMGVYNAGDADNFFGVMEEDAESKEWFEEYTNYFNTGIISDKYKELNISRLHKLETMYLKEDLTNPYIRQKILEMGWNPFIPFTSTNRVLADKKIKSILSEQMNRSEIIDLREFGDAQSQDFDNKEEPSTSDVEPIYIVLEEGKRPIFSDAIKAATDGIYSHAMIGFDPSLTKLYSFGVDTKVKKTGSFIIESIKNKPKDIMLKVYTIFVDSKIYNMIKNNIEWFKEHQRQTHYAWFNLIYFLFKIPHDNDVSMICSQFVDKMLKLGGVDITNRASSLVSPNDIDRAAKKKRTIYQVFSDKLVKYKEDKVARKIAKLKQKAKVYKEEAISSFLVNENAFILGTRIAFNDSYLLESLADKVNNFNDKRLVRIYETFLIPCLEAREIPVQFNTNGDLIVRRITPVDFEAAYAKSHKLLVEYSKANNAEGMKHELANLWYLNILIEKKLHTKFSLTKKEDLYKARAKILNDFKKYLQEVQQHYDKNFNFAKYFEESPYSDAAYRVSGSTVKHTIALLKQLL